MTRRLVLTATLAATALVACSKGATEAGGTAGTTTSAAPLKLNPGAVKVEFFVMSQCPYGTQVENGIKETLEKLGSDVDFKVDFIGQGAAPNFTSMHGPNEVAGDIAQLCAAKHGSSTFVAFLACQNKNAKDVATNWESCSNEVKGPTAAIKGCIEGPEGKQLLGESFAKSASRGAQGSPTMFINSKPYNGRRDSLAFLRAICAEYTGTKPAPCLTIPEPPKVNVTIITDSRCAECKTDQFVGIIKSQVGNPVITQLDYATPEGRKAFDALPNADTVKVPVVLFDETVKADAAAMGAFGRYMSPLGAFTTLAIGAEHLPACANEGGCELPACKNTLGCRKETPNTLDVFVMSQCPYGVQALNAMQEVLQNFSGTPLAFNVNYIGSGDAAKGLTSMHGQGEVDEDLREVCAIKKNGKNAKFMDYVLCRNKEIRSTDWEKCATNGIDAKAIKACAEGDEGKKLLAESFALSSSLGIGASPTWLANGRFKFSGVDAQTIKSNICQRNPTLKGCDKTLSGPAAGAAAQQGGCAQ